MRTNLFCLALLALPTVAAAQGADTPTVQQARAMINSDPAAAAKAFEAIAQAEPENGEAWFLLGYTLHMNGNLDRAHDTHLKAARYPQYAALGHYNHACVHALRGEKDEAFLALGFAREMGFNDVDQLLQDSDMDNLRTDARFRELLVEMQGGENVIQASISTTPAARRIDFESVDPERMFDFRVGEWTVRREGEPQRRQVVTPIFDGRGLQSESFGEGGTATSRSQYVFSPDSGTWKQVWCSAEGQCAILRSEIVDGTLVLRQVSVDGEAAPNGRAVFRDVTDRSYSIDWQVSEAGDWTTVVTIAFEKQ